MFDCIVGPLYSAHRSKGHRVRRMSVKVRAVWVGAGVVAAWCSMAAAQTYYKWTDDKGVVHFADVPPAQGTAEERHLPAAPAVKPREPAQAREAAVAETPTAFPGEGPARVILVSRQLPRTGPSSMHMIGEVKNVGGAEARRVAVTITAVDITAGTPCLNEEAAVTPSNLRPGESGRFDVDVDSPCLAGRANVDVAPIWD